MRGGDARRRVRGEAARQARREEAWRRGVALWRWGGVVAWGRGEAARRGEQARLAGASTWRGGEVGEGEEARRGGEVRQEEAWRCGAVAVWRCGVVAAWRCGVVAAWRVWRGGEVRRAGMACRCEHVARRRGRRGRRGEVRRGEAEGEARRQRRAGRDAALAVMWRAGGGGELAAVESGASPCREN